MSITKITKGAVVRLKNRKRKAVVVGDKITIGNEVVEGGVFLDKPLGGFRYWNADELSLVKI